MDVPVFLYLSNFVLPVLLDCGSCADVGKPTSGSPIVIRAAGEFQSESDKDGAKCSVEQTSVVDSNASKALSCSQDPKQNDASKDERSFTFEVSPLANMPLKSADNKWQSFFNIPATKVSPVNFRHARSLLPSHYNLTLNQHYLL
jgi:hypothetical protein